MFGITELDELVFQQLDRHELAQCMRVNKTWHEVAVPFLWSDLTYLENLPWDQRQAFGRLVLEDYLRVQQQHRKLKEEGQDMGQHTSPISNLAKYGRCVRLLAAEWDLILLFKINTELALIRQEERPTYHELFLHLFDYCPTAKVSTFHYLHPRRPSDLSPAEIERILPRVLNLDIHTYDNHTMKAQYLIGLLDHCSSTLVTLKMNVVLKDSKDEMDDRQEEEIFASKAWMSLTHLKLARWGDHPGYDMLRRWLLRRCSCVQKIEVSQGSPISQKFVEDALTYMPNLKEIVMKDGGLRDHNNAAAILSASRHGWRTVTIGYPSIGKAAKMSLAKHLSTLQMLDVSRCDSFRSDDLVKILSSCPHLHTLKDHFGDRIRMHFNAFIDQDPSTGLLKAWACEPSLRVLDIKVTGIPRPDWKGRGEDRFIVEEAYNGQGREIQELVYDRLARLTHLETIVMASIFASDFCSCPEFTLESGLHKLAGLKSLEKLDVWSMMAELGLKEVQWMAEHWPSLCLLQARVADEEGTLKWLKEHHPLISLEGKD